MLVKVDGEEDLVKTDGMIGNLVAEVWNLFVHAKWFFGCLVMFYVFKSTFYYFSFCSEVFNDFVAFAFSLKNWYRWCVLILGGPPRRSGRGGGRPGSVLILLNYLVQFCSVLIVWHVWYLAVLYCVFCMVEFVKWNTGRICWQYCYSRNYTLQPVATLF